MHVHGQAFRTDSNCNRDDSFCLYVIADVLFGVTF
jgi:hypothetical protein